MTVVVATLALSVVFCSLYLKLAQHYHLLAVPNHRSAHSEATPHGGGLPLILAFGCGLLLATISLEAWSPRVLELTALAAALMALGVIDDHYNLPIGLRLASYTAASVLAVLLVFTPDVADMTLADALGLAVLAVGVLWLLNLYNFMDGIDGIAASECVCVCVVVALLAASKAGSGEYVLYLLLLAAAQAGFLLMNWAPARLFMGDAGSVPTGFLLAVMALYGEHYGLVSLASWLILLALFVTDASWTLAWRIVDGQRFTKAHALHGYQRLARRFGSHARVVTGLIVVNLLWLAPLAWAADRFPDLQFFLVILAYLPLLIGMGKAFKFP